MNKELMPSLITLGICGHLSMSLEEAEGFIYAASVLDDYFEHRLKDVVIGTQQLMVDSENEQLINSFVEFIKLMSFGLQVPMPKQVLTEYLEIMSIYTFLSTVVAYNQGRADALGGVPPAFDSFIKDLDFEEE